MRYTVVNCNMVSSFNINCSGHFSIEISRNSFCKMNNEVVLLFGINNFDLTPALSKGEGVAVFPNPVEDEFTIHDARLMIGAAVEISIYNVLGEEMQPPVDCRLWTVDCRLLQRGMYYIEITTNNKTFRCKFLKQ